MTPEAHAAFVAALLKRLDHDPDVLGLVLLGSSSGEPPAPDAFSDHDLFVVTRPGAGGSLAVAELAQARPDGYTIILAPLSTLIIHPQLNDLPYKTPDDYEPIINVVSYSLLTVKADAPWKTVQDFIAAAKDAPTVAVHGARRVAGHREPAPDPHAARAWGAGARPSCGGRVRAAPPRTDGAAG